MFNDEGVLCFGLFVQCPPFHRLLTLDQQECDNNNRMIQVTGVLSTLFRLITKGLRLDRLVSVGTDYRY
jgi:hypothetical protein